MVRPLRSQGWASIRDDTTPIGPFMHDHRVRARRLTPLTLLAALVLAAVPVAPAAAAEWTYVDPGVPQELADELVLWRAVSPTPDGSGVVFYGGNSLSAPGSPAGSSMWMYNGSWVAICGTTVTGATMPCAPGPRSVSQMAPTTAGVMLYGGSPVVLGSDGSGYGSLTDDTWMWNGSSWSEVCADCAPGNRGSAAMASSADLSHVIMFGGLRTGGGDPFPDDTWRYDAGSETWTQICGTGMTPSDPCGPDGRLGAQMAWDGTQFVMFGGSQGLGPADTYFDDTWTFDPVAETWTQVCGTGTAMACGPSRRIFGSMASLPNASPPGALLVGGSVVGVEPEPPDDGPADDTWFWDGSGWVQLQTFSPTCGVGSPVAGGLGGTTAVLLGVAFTSGSEIQSTGGRVGGWDLAGGTTCGDPQPPDPPVPPGPNPPDPGPGGSNGPAGPGDGSGRGGSGSGAGADGTGPGAATLPATGAPMPPVVVALVALLALTGGGVLVRTSLARRD